MFSTGKLFWLLSAIEGTSVETFCFVFNSVYVYIDAILLILLVVISIQVVIELDEYEVFQKRTTKIFVGL